MSSYSEWLKTQPKAFQDDTLGKERAEAFRSGTLDVEKFKPPVAMNLEQFKSKRSLISGKGN